MIIEQPIMNKLFIDEHTYWMMPHITFTKIVCTKAAACMEIE